MTTKILQPHRMRYGGRGGEHMCSENMCLFTDGLQPKTAQQMLQLQRRWSTREWVSAIRPMAESLKQTVRTVMHVMGLRRAAYDTVFKEISARWFLAFETSQATFRVPALALATNDLIEETHTDALGPALALLWSQTQRRLADAERLGL